MLSYYDLRKGVQFILEGQPYEVITFSPMQKAQDVVVVQTKIRNLITGKILSKNFHQRDNFQEAEIEKVNVKFIYAHRDKFVFAYDGEPSKRFEIKQDKIGDKFRFLKTGLVLVGLVFNGEIINIDFPIKLHLKVIQASPGVKGNRSQAGTKAVTLETKATINVPLFVEAGDIIEVNTETGEYVKRIE